MIYSPEAIAFSVTTVAVAIAKDRDEDELELLAAAFSQLGDTLALMCVQRARIAERLEKEEK